MGGQARTIDGAVLATRGWEQLQLVAPLWGVVTIANVALLADRVVNGGDQSPYLLAAVVCGLLALAPALWAFHRVVLASKRADLASRAPTAVRAPVVIEPFFRAARGDRPRMWLRVLSPDGERLGCVGSGLLLPGIDCRRFTVCVGHPVPGAAVALETPDGRERLLPGTDFRTQEPATAEWSAAATDLCGWTAVPDDRLLARASAVRADRLRLLRSSRFVTVLVLVLLWSPLWLLGCVAFLLLAVGRVAWVRRQARVALEPEIARVAPGAVRWRGPLAEALVLLDPGNPRRLPLPPPPDASAPT